MRHVHRWAVLGGLLAVAGLTLPWTHNRIDGSRWLVELAAGHGGLIALYVGALAALTLAVVAIVLRAPRVAVLGPAAVGLLIMIIAVLTTPRGDVLFDGADSTGRPYGGSEPTTWSAGPAVSLLGAVLLLVVCLRHTRSVGRRG